MLTALQQEQVEQLAPVARSIASRFSRSAKWAEDLQSEAYMGLIAAVQKHRQKDGDLTRYCRGVMSYYMLRYLSHERKHLRRERPSGALQGVQAREAPYDSSVSIDTLASYKLLSARERGVLALYYGLNGDVPRTLAEIGRDIGVTEARVQQIVHAALGKLGRCLGA